MTAQIEDTVTYARSKWDLAGVNGDALFDPRPLGLKIGPASTACWRGYVCTYAVRDNTLLLHGLDIAIDGEPPVLFGRAPRARKSLGLTARYVGLSRPIAFTGGLLLARDFLQHLYAHMGFHPAWKYERVVEIEFDSGHVLKVTDCSDAMAQIRARFTGTEQPTTRPSNQEISKWIERTFSRKY